MYHLHLFLTVLEAQKYNIKVPAILCLVRALFLICRCLSSGNIVQWPRKSPQVSSSFYKRINSITMVSFSWPNLNVIAFQRPQVQIPPYWGLGLHFMKWAGGRQQKHSVHSRNISVRTESDLMCHNKLAFESQGFRARSFGVGRQIDHGVWKENESKEICS